MCQVDSFLCGCAPLRKGALIIGSIKLVMMLMMLLVTIISRMIPLEESEMTNYKFPGFLSLLWWQWWWWVWCQWRWSDSGGDPNSLGWGDALRTAPRSQQGRFPSTSSFPLSYMIWYDFFQLSNHHPKLESCTLNPIYWSFGFFRDGMRLQVRIFHILIKHLILKISRTQELISYMYISQLIWIIS